MVVRNSPTLCEVNSNIATQTRVLKLTTPTFQCTVNPPLIDTPKLRTPGHLQTS